MTAAVTVPSARAVPAERDRVPMMVMDGPHTLISAHELAGRQLLLVLPEDLQYGDILVTGTSSPVIRQVDGPVQHEITLGGDRYLAVPVARLNGHYVGKWSLLSTSMVTVFR